MVTPEHGGQAGTRLSELVALAVDRLQETGRDGLDELLLAHPEAATAIRRRLQILDEVGMLELGTAPTDNIPEQLGEYRIIERLGQGGMGVVFVADQPSLKRQVALKVIRPENLFFGASRQRFRREIEAVARLQHPGIVSVYAAGEEKGLPYFTMEKIAGISLDRLLEQLRSNVPAKLDENDVRAALVELGGGDNLPPPSPRPRSWVEITCQWMRELTDAADYAHRHDVLHRDIKPSNIMISWSMRAMLLDFGLARVAGSSEITRSGVLVGSVPYMAPEQLSGDPSDIGVPTDVYALGVLLYEMLTLRNPFHDGSSSEEETRQRIVAATPPPVRLINAAVSWDAETVCRCAMAPEPERRYQDAAALGHDLQNLLDLRPITARRASSSVRVRRYVRRHPAHAVAVLMGMLLLVATPTVIAVTEHSLRQEITQAKEDAELEADTRADILRFFRDELLAAVSPEEVGKDATMREVLDVASTKVEGRFPERPLVEAAIRETLGDTYRDLGVLDAAELHLTRALALYREHAGAHDRAALSVDRGLGMVYSQQGRFAELEKLERRNFELCRDRFGGEDSATLAAANNLGLTLTRLDKHVEAERFLLDVVETRLRLLGEQHTDTQVSMSNLGLLYYDMGRLDEAESWVKRELELCRATEGDDHPSTLISRQNYANLLGKMGRVADAVAAMERVVAASRRVRGDDHPETFHAMVSCADWIMKAKRYDDAVRLWDEALRCIANLGADHPRVLFALVHRAESLRLAGRLDQASEAVQVARRRCHDVLGIGKLTSEAQAVHARLLVDQGQREAAASLYVELLVDWPTGSKQALAHLRLGHARNLFALERHEEAEHQLQQALQFFATNAVRSPQHGEVLQEFVAVCEATKRLDAAAIWRQRFADWQAATVER